MKRTELKKMLESLTINELEEFKHATAVFAASFEARGDKIGAKGEQSVLRLCNKELTKRESLEIKP